jgi:hypothetical protein
MKPTKLKNTRLVFLIKGNDESGIIQDEVIKVGEDRFKSIKFRHTHYKEADFNTSLEEVEKVVNSKYGISLQSLSQ